MLTIVCIFGVARADDDLARYIWQKTNDQLVKAQIAATGQKVQAILFAELIRYDKHRKVIQHDSARAEAFGHDGVLDSFVLLNGEASLLVSRSISWPDFSRSHYVTSSFPNDTGGLLVTLNLDLDTTQFMAPVGVITIDRIAYQPVSAHLSFPVNEGEKRRSQLLTSVYVDGAIYPRTLKEIVVERGVLSEEYYVLSLRLDSLRLDN